MSNFFKDIDLELDRLPIPEQLNKAEEVTEYMAASMVVLNTLLGRLASAARAGVVSDNEAERILALQERINSIIAAAQERLVVEI